MIKKFIIMLLTCLFVLPAMAGDELRQGADNSPNALAGPVTYNRPSCFDGTTWDVIDCVTAAVPTYVDVVKLGGVTINLGTGAIGTGTQRVTLATDDPAVVDLASLALAGSGAIDDDATDSCMAVTAVAADWTNTNSGGLFEITVTGGNVYANGDGAATTAAAGHFTVFHEGTTRRDILTEATISVITSGGTAEVCFSEIN